VTSAVAPPTPPKGTQSAQSGAASSGAKASASGTPAAGKNAVSGNEPPAAEPPAATADAADKGPGALPPSYKLSSDKFAGIQVEGRAVPTFGDLDGDGDLDLLVGTGKGAVLFYRNTGTKQEAKWALVQEPLLDRPPGRNASILLVDMDGDGLLDLLAGSEDGKVSLYKNTGSKEQAKFTRTGDALGGIAVGRNAAPAVLPLADDPVGQMLVGSFGGSVFLYTRQGGARSLNFKLQDRRFLGKGFGVSATPFVGDMDQDGIPDLLVGSDKGAIAHFIPSGNAKKPWKPGEDYFKELKLPQGSTPRLADIDGDGQLDLFVGSEQGTILYYANEAGAADKSGGK
jgi:hypothetical protein